LSPNDLDFDLDRVCGYSCMHLYTLSDRPATRSRPPSTLRPRGLYYAPVRV
jgi:hypothetical protein